MFVVQHDTEKYDVQSALGSHCQRSRPILHHRSSYSMDFEYALESKGIRVNLYSVAMSTVQSLVIFFLSLYLPFFLSLVSFLLFVSRKHDNIHEA